MSQSKVLKLCLKERSLLETVLKGSEDWKNDAGSLLQDARCFFDMTNISDGLTGVLISRIENLVTRIESVRKTGLSFGLDLDEIPKLEDACSALQWCEKALSFCSNIPSFEVFFNDKSSVRVCGRVCGVGVVVVCLFFFFCL